MESAGTKSVCLFPFIWLLKVALPIFEMSKDFKQYLHIAMVSRFPGSRISHALYSLLAKHAVLNVHVLPIISAFLDILQ